jgi:gas vesicle protein
MTGKTWHGMASGILIGLGAGVAIGVLLAPKSGQKTREQIAGATKDKLDEAIAMGHDLSRRMQQTLDDAKERVNEATEVGEQAFRKAKSASS